MPEKFEKKCLCSILVPIQEVTSFRVALFGSVLFRFVHGMVRAVPVFGSDRSSLERALSGSILFNVKGRLRFWFRFLYFFCGSDGSGSSFGSWKNGSDGSASGSTAILLFGGMPSQILV